MAGVRVQQQKNRRALPLKKRKAEDALAPMDNDEEDSSVGKMAKSCIEFPRWISCGKSRVLDRSAGPMKRFSSVYSLKKELGQGMFGIVWECVHIETQVTYACKVFQKRTKDAKVEMYEDIRQEIMIMERVSGHQNVVQVKEAFEDMHRVYIVMELCDGGELFNMVTKQCYPEREAAKVFKELAMAVAHCHRRGVVHRDLKPENIFLATKFEDGKPHPLIKLGDFGLAAVLDENGKCSGTAGSPFYMSPEVVNGQSCGKETDIWSLGVILYILLSGVPPFWGSTASAQYDAIRRNQPSFSDDVWKNVSYEAEDLIKLMCQTDPSERPTAEDVLADAWFKMQEGLETASPVNNDSSRQLSSGLTEVTGSKPSVNPAVLIVSKANTSEYVDICGSGDEGETEESSRGEYFVPGLPEGSPIWSDDVTEKRGAEDVLADADETDEDEDEELAGQEHLGRYLQTGGLMGASAIYFRKGKRGQFGVYQPMQKRQKVTGRLTMLRNKRAGQEGEIGARRTGRTSGQGSVVTSWSPFQSP